MSSGTYDSDIEYRIDMEQMNAMLRGVRSGKRQYEEDVDTLRDGLSKASSLSPIAYGLYDNLTRKLNSYSDIDGFDNVIRRLDNIV